jgi:hypothetical protein
MYGTSAMWLFLYRFHSQFILRIIYRPQWTYTNFFQVGFCEHGSEHKKVVILPSSPRLITDMEQSRSWEADSRFASKEISAFYGTLMFIITVRQRSLSWAT